MQEIIFYLIFLISQHQLYEVDGYKIYINKDESRMMTERVSGNYEKDKRIFIKKHLKEGMTFVDVGANHGYHSLLAAKIIGDKGRVIAIEPIIENCIILGKSVEANEYKNFIIYPIALYDKSEILDFWIGIKSGWGSIKREDARNKKIKRLIRARTLDEILADTVKVNFIKIDVQGAEFEVLRGAERTLINNPDIVLSLDFDRYNVKEIVDYLSELGFKFYEEKPPFNVPRKSIKEFDKVIVRR